MLLTGQVQLFKHRMSLQVREFNSLEMGSSKTARSSASPVQRSHVGRAAPEALATAAMRGTWPDELCWWRRQTAAAPAAAAAAAAAAEAAVAASQCGGAPFIANLLYAGMCGQRWTCATGTAA